MQEKFYVYRFCFESESPVKICIAEPTEADSVLISELLRLSRIINYVSDGGRTRSGFRTCDCFVPLAANLTRHNVQVISDI
jgi:hypothetical protein